MKVLLFVVALIFSGGAAAAPPCYPFGIKGESQFKNEWFKRTDNGWYMFWLCKAPNALWESHGLYCRHGNCVQQTWIDVQTALGQAPDRSAAADAAYAKYVTAGQCFDEITNNTPNAPICRELQTAMKDALAVVNPAPPSPTDVWKVKPSGTAATRVVYTVVNGKRGPLALNPDGTTKTVAVGTVCDQSVKITETIGTLVNVYMGVPGGIAVCAKQ